MHLNALNQTTDRKPEPDKPELIWVTFYWLKPQTTRKINSKHTPNSYNQILEIKKFDKLPMKIDSKERKFFL